MHNVYQKFRQLLPDPPLQVGTAIEIGNGVITVALPGGGLVKARGSAEVGENLFVRDGVVEGVAPSLPVVLIDI